MSTSIDSNAAGQAQPLSNVQIIVGSTRAGRNADAVYRWLLPAIQSNGAFAVETLDLRDWPLPLFQETIATVGDFANPKYSEPL